MTAGRADGVAAASAHAGRVGGGAAAARGVAELAWPEAERRAPGAVLAVPVGATEQHGPHLPLSTDTDIAIAVAEGLARRRPDVVVAPPVAYGSSGEHAAFAGTLSIGQAALELLLVELVRSARATFARMLLISAHGGNRAPVERAGRRLRAEGADVRVLLAACAGDAHAGRTETSLMLALHPDRVRVERAERGATEPLAALMPELLAHGVRHVSPNGVLGDPAGASAEEGRHLLERLVDDAVHAVDGW